MSKIAFLNQSLSFGGAEKMMAFVIRSVAPHFEEVFLLQFTDESGDYELPDNIKYYNLGGNDSTKSIIGKIKLFHFRIKKVRLFLKDNDISLICSFGFYYTFMAILATQSTNTKVVASERRSPEDDGFLWGNISKWSYSKCSRVVFQLQRASDYYRDIPEEKKIVIPNPYLMRESIVQYNQGLTNKEIVMAAARLEYVKGFDIGIKAMSIVLKKHPNYKLVIYGKGDFNRQYGKLIEELGINENIVYKGHSNQILSDIIKSEIFLLPSRVEGIPNMLLEAMGVGMPCVATDCRPGGARLLLGDSQYGLLVNNEDYQGVANAILRLLDNPGLLMDMSKKAQMVRERFSENEISNKWVKCFKEAIEV